MKIGIIGQGVVGTALYRGFKQKGYAVLCYDKHKETPNSLIDTVAKSKVLFICVPTPEAENGSVDLSIVDEVIMQIAAIAERNLLKEKLIVIKSTVIPGTTRKYQVKYKDLFFFSSPEFLDSDFAIRDFLNPDKIIIGYTGLSKKFVQIVSDIFYPFNSQILVMRSDEAEMVKYMTNAYYALKTIFGNEIYDFCQHVGLDYDVVRDAFIVNRRVGNSHFEPFHKGGRGAGGACLPKDLNALLHFDETGGSSFNLLKKVQNINAKLLRGSGKK